MNIFQLAYELQDIINQLEENGGEITPEIEEQLYINQEGVKHKVEAYTQVVHQLESDIEAIKVESKRLADLKKRKEATIESVKKLILYAIDMFGETAKSETKFIDFGTGKVSTRKSENLEVDENAYKELANDIKHIICWAGFINQPETVDLSIDNLLTNLEIDTRECVDGAGDYEFKEPIEATEDDLQAATAKFIIPIAVRNLQDDKMSELIQTIARLANDRLKVEVDVDKQYLKNTQKSDGNCKLSKLIQKTNVIIK
jgi:hypothetical protein